VNTEGGPKVEKATVGSVSTALWSVVEIADSALRQGSWVGWPVHTVAGSEARDVKEQAMRSTIHACSLTRGDRHERV